jgi:hypothetical protein
MTTLVRAQKLTQADSTLRDTLGKMFLDPQTGKNIIYVQADGVLTSGDYCDVDPYSGQAKKCQGNGGQGGLLCIARATYADNEYGYLESVDKGVYEGFRNGGICAGTSNTGLPTGTAGDENILITAGGNYFEYHILGTQTILRPVFTLGTGINISLDQTADDGVELTMGIRATDKYAFVVGQDGAFHMKVKFSVADVSGTDDLVVGFRKAEAYQAAVDDYDEMAALQIIDTVINVHTILNDGATTVTDTTNTVADGVAVTFGIHVSAAGVVTFTIDGAAPTATAAFTFDDGEVVVPFFFFLHHTDVAGNVIITDWEVGQD